MEKHISEPTAASSSRMPRIALFAGSFDPFTIGHADIVRRALSLFDRLVIVVAVNPDKRHMFTVEERVQFIGDLYRDDDRVEVMAHEGLMADLGRQIGARFNVRGVRSVIDFEYEKMAAEYNERLGGLETVLLYSSPALASVSSTAYRQLVFFHKDAEAAALLPSPSSAASPSQG